MRSCSANHRPPTAQRCDCCGVAGVCGCTSLAREPRARRTRCFLMELGSTSAHACCSHRVQPSTHASRFGNVVAGDSTAAVPGAARRDERRRHDPIVRERARPRITGAWFEVEADGMRAHADALVRHAEVDNVDDMSMIELASYPDAIEIVRHDCFTIYVNCTVAIDGLQESEVSLERRSGSERSQRLDEARAHVHRSIGGRMARHRSVAHRVAAHAH